MLCDNFMVSCINHKKMLTDNTPREDAIPEIRARRRTPGKVTYCVAGFPGGRTSRPDLLLSQTVYRFWVTDYPDQKNPSVTNRKVHCRMTEPATKHKKRSPFNGKTFFIYQTDFVFAVSCHFPDLDKPFIRSTIKTAIWARYAVKRTADAQRLKHIPLR